MNVFLLLAPDTVQTKLTFKMLLWRKTQNNTERIQSLI